MVQRKTEGAKAKPKDKDMKKMCVWERESVDSLIGIIRVK